MRKRNGAGLASALPDNEARKATHDLGEIEHSLVAENETQPQLLPGAISNSLTDLAVRIRMEHAACASALQRGLEHAVAAGKLLIEAKAQIPHGQWLQWLREHVQIPERTAQRYMAVAPYAAETAKNDKLADLTGDAVAALAPPQPPDQAETEDEVRALAQWCLNRPFCDEDVGELGPGFHWDWFKTKLLHQAQVPALASILLSTDFDLKLLCLCPFDELVETAKTLAPIASGERALKVDCSTMRFMINAIGIIQILAMRLTGGVLEEISRRRKITDETYEREWHETHARWMAHLEAKIAEVRPS